jgi:hypothetical protein
MPFVSRKYVSAIAPSGLCTLWGWRRMLWFGLVWFGLVWFGGGKCHWIDECFTDFNNGNSEEL